MEQDYRNSLQNGFVISKTHNKLNTLLKEEDYTALQQSDTLYDILTKLSLSSYKLSSEINSNHALKIGLYQNLKKEFDEAFKNAEENLKMILQFYKNQHMIQNFTYLLASKEHDPELLKSYDKIEEMGKFLELETLKFACDMHEVYKFCVEHTFLKKYYKHLKIKKEIKDNDFQQMNILMQKMLLEDFYNELNEDCFMREMLKAEGDRRIVEIVLNTADSHIIGKKRKDLFPNVSTIDLGMKLKLSDCVSFDELRGILSQHHKLRKIVSFDDEGIVAALVNLETEMYMNSFKRHNDVSCVYSYFKLKEQEIKNIIWTVDCVSLNKKDFVKKIVLPKTIVE
ncbi:hypothetical protein GVAV_000137 [Gurleya vavrai]